MTCNKLAIVFALREEVKPLLREAKVLSRILERPTLLTKAEWRGASLLLCQTGIGGPAASHGVETLLKHFSPSLILSVGYAGGIGPFLQVGDLVLPSEVRSPSDAEPRPIRSKEREFLETLIREEGIRYETGTLISLPNVADRMEKEAWQGKGIAVDMETAALFAAAARKEVPFLSLRAIFDPVDEDPPQKNLASLLRLPQFYRRNRICQRNLTRVLARFIDSYGR